MKRNHIGMTVRSILFMVMLLRAIQQVDVATAAEGLRGTGAERTPPVQASYEDAAGSLEGRLHRGAEEMNRLHPIVPKGLETPD
jgi:hypothetical protein